MNTVDDPSPTKTSLDTSCEVCSVLNSVNVDPSSDTSNFPVVVLNLIKPSAAVGLCAVVPFGICIEDVPSKT